MSKNIPDKISNSLRSANREKLDSYLKFFDRILLYNMAAHLLSDDIKENIVQMWSDRMKDIINDECNGFTTYLQETSHGRLVSMLPEQNDGEDMRLNFIKTLGVADDIIRTNLFAPTSGEDEEFSS